MLTIRGHIQVIQSKTQKKYPFTYIFGDILLTFCNNFTTCIMSKLDAFPYFVVSIFTLYKISGLADKLKMFNFDTDASSRKALVLEH